MNRVRKFSELKRKEYLDTLDAGVDAWNEYIEANGGGLTLFFLNDVDLGGRDLGSINLSGVILTNANLSRCNLSGAQLVRTSLGGANLNSADLLSANLTEANLRNAVLDGANLSGAHIDNAVLDGVRMNALVRGAELRSTSLRRANLADADLTGADIRWSDFTGSDLSGADMTDVLIDETVFANSNLKGTKGLANCEFDGPTTIDHRTLSKSGKLPLAFLRGCGLPDSVIDLYSPGKPIGDFESCFISYSQFDEEFARKLHADLQDAGIRCWFAPHDIQGGKKIHEQIDQAILNVDRVLLILSNSSMSSAWVETEIAKARKRELKDRKRILFPVRLVQYEALKDWECFDADTGKDSAREIREYYIPDFSRWHLSDYYNAELEKLIRDLKSHSHNS